jgi:hypothetical protein
MFGRWESQLSNISERLVVRCPVREASYFLAAFVADHQLMNGAVQIALSSPVSRFVDRRPPSERAVVAHSIRWKRSATRIRHTPLRGCRRATVPPPNSPVPWPSSGFRTTAALGCCCARSARSMTPARPCAAAGPRTFARPMSCALSLNTSKKRAPITRRRWPGTGR